MGCLPYLQKAKLKYSGCKTSWSMKGERGLEPQTSRKDGLINGIYCLP
jgi:hypothetical protein